MAENLEKVRQISPEAIKTIDTNQVAYFTLTDGSVVVVNPEEKENSDVVEQKEIIEIETTEAVPEMEQNLQQNNEEQNQQNEEVKIEYINDQQPENNKIIVNENFEKLGNSENLQQNLNDEGKILSYGGTVEERNNYKFYVSGVGYVDPNEAGFLPDNYQQDQGQQEVCCICGNVFNGDSCDVCQSQEKVENKDEGQNLRNKEFKIGATTRIGNVQGIIRQNGQLYKVIEAVPVKLNEYDNIEYEQNNTENYKKTQLRNVNEKYVEENRQQYNNVISPKEKYVYTQQQRPQLEEFVENVEEQQYNNTYENNYGNNYENNYDNNYENVYNIYENNYENNYDNNYDNNYNNNYDNNYENVYNTYENNYENKYENNYDNNNTYANKYESKYQSKNENTYKNTYESKYENNYKNTYENEENPEKLVCICGLGNVNLANENVQNEIVQRRCYTEYQDEDEKPKCICNLGIVVKDGEESKEIRKKEILKSLKRPLRESRQREGVTNVITRTSNRDNYNYYESFGYSAKARIKSERERSGRK